MIEISVKGELQELTTTGETRLSEAKDTVEMELKAKFSDVIDDPVMVEIFKAASKQLMKDSK